MQIRWNMEKRTNLIFIKKAPFDKGGLKSMPIAAGNNFLLLNFIE